MFRKVRHACIEKHMFLSKRGEQNDYKIDPFNIWYKLIINNYIKNQVKKFSIVPYNFF